jgi:hypothetical protein
MPLGSVFTSRSIFMRDTAYIVQFQRYHQRTDNFGRQIDHLVEIADRIEVGPNQLASGRIVQYSPARQRAFDEDKAMVRERVVAKLRRDLYAAIVRQEVGFFDEQRTGDLVSRLSSDTTVLQNAVSLNVSMALRYGLTIIGRFYEKAEPPPKVIVDNPDDEQWVAKKGRRLAIWTGGAELKLTNQVDDAQQSLFQIASDGGIKLVPPAGKLVEAGENGDYLLKKPVYDALVTFATSCSNALNPQVSEIKAAGTALLTALQLPPIPITTILKGA